MDNQISESTDKVFNLPEIYTEDNYLESGKRLAKAGQFLNWQIGRWYNALEWGDKREICEKVGINYASASDCGSIDKKIKSSLRNENLTFQHHKVVAVKALDDDQREQLLQQAEDKKLSSKQLTGVRDVMLGRDVVNPDSASSNAVAQRKLNDKPAQATDNTIPLEGEPAPGVETEPAAYYGDAPEQKSYDAQPEENKILADLKRDNEYLTNELKLIKQQVENGKGDREAKQALEKECDELKSQVIELERVAALDAAIMADKDDKIKALETRLAKPETSKPAKKSSKAKPATTNVCAYDGNQKDFTAEVKRVAGKADNNFIAAIKKEGIAALKIEVTKSGRLTSNEDRLKFIAWLKSKK